MALCGHSQKLRNQQYVLVVSPLDTKRHTASLVILASSDVLVLTTRCMRRLSRPLDLSQGQPESYVYSDSSSGIDCCAHKSTKSYNLFPYRFQHILVEDRVSFQSEFRMFWVFLVLSSEACRHRFCTQ